MRELRDSLRVDGVADGRSGAGVREPFRTGQPLSARGCPRPAGLGRKYPETLGTRSPTAFPVTLPVIVTIACSIGSSIRQPRYRRSNGGTERCPKEKHWPGASRYLEARRGLRRKALGQSRSPRQLPTPPSPRCARRTKHASAAPRRELPWHSCSDKNPACTFHALAKATRRAEPRKNERGCRRLRLASWQALPVERVPPEPAGASAPSRRTPTRPVRARAADHCWFHDPQRDALHCGMIGCGDLEDRCVASRRSRCACSSRRRS